MATAASFFRTLPPEGAAAGRQGLSRHFFLSLMLVYALVAVIGFAPSLYGFSQGTFPMTWAAHLHGALMVSWLALLVTQAALPARARVPLHRRIGRYVAAFAALIWCSMIAITFWKLDEINPQPGHFAYNILLLQGMIILLFPLFFGWALAERRSPGWHKRLMVITALLPLQAAIDRMIWLPNAPGQQWVNFLYLDLLLVPMLVFDWRTLRRIHPATAIGGAILVAVQLGVLMLWQDPAWHAFAHGLTSGLR